ncbi:hypothetical protein J6590_071858 [Homalodisca vitripennis]|nr:hypothetical protein J6590_071858 [Homalodisca vitripennis]
MTGLSSRPSSMSDEGVNDWAGRRHVHGILSAHPSKDVPSLDLFGPAKADSYLRAQRSLQFHFYSSKKHICGLGVSDVEKTQKVRFVRLFRQTWTQDSRSRICNNVRSQTLN